MISKKEFENIYAEIAPVYRQKLDDLRIFGCLTIGGYPIFGANFIRNDESHWVFFYMNKPEIFMDYDGEYVPTKEDLQELNELLDMDTVWEDIIFAEKERLHEDYNDLPKLMIDFSEIPTVHPDYTKIIT